MTATLVLKTLLQMFHILAYSTKLGKLNRRSSGGLQNFRPAKGTKLLTLTILAGGIKMNTGPRFLCWLCKNTVKLNHLKHTHTHTHTHNKKKKKKKKKTG